MDFQIRITEAALADFEEILAYSWVNFPATATRFGNAILNHVELLRSFPYIGSPVDGWPDVLQLIHTPILIYYRVNEAPNFIEVLHFWHGSRNAPHFLISLFQPWRYTKTVYTGIVKNITLSAEEELIERARLRAAREKRTLNAAFRDWLERYAGSETGRHEYAELMKRLSHVRNTRHFSRDEMNER